MARVSLAALLVLGLAFAAEAEVTSLEGANLGQHWTGPEYTLSDLEGRVVFFENWGYNCGPCRASIPHLVKMQDKYRDLGFVIIGSHVQNVPREQVLGLCRQLGVNFTVTSQGRVQGDQSNGIPQAFLFDWNGKLVAEGHPSSLYSKVDELMSRAPHFLAGGRSFTDRDVAKEAARLKGGKGFGRIIKNLDRLADKLEGDGAEEARFLGDRLRAHGEGLLGQARSDEADAPAKAWMGYRQVEALYDGHPLADQADERLKELKKDDAFQHALKADQLWLQIEQLSGQLKEINGKMDPAHPANRRTVQQMGQRMKMLDKKYSDTPAYTKAKDLLASLGLM